MLGCYVLFVYIDIVVIFARAVALAGENVIKVCSHLSSATELLYLDIRYALHYIILYTTYKHKINNSILELHVKSCTYIMWYMYDRTYMHGLYALLQFS